jgi:hypothetical protein
LKPGSSIVSVGGNTRSPQTACAWASVGRARMREAARAAPLALERGIEKSPLIEIK